MNQIEQVLQKYRMSHLQNDCTEEGKRINRLFGLKTLIDENLSGNSMVCEVGSFMGVSSELFALMCRLVYCIDVFDANLAGIEYESKFDEVYRKYANIIKIKGRSPEIAETFTDYMFDFIYIDGMHDYESVKADILGWRKKVKPGGFIGGHDYITKVGIIQATNDVFGKVDKVYEDSSWIVKL